MRALKSICVWAATCAAVAAALFVVVAHLGPAIVGWMPFAVATGSMDPAYPPGGAVIVDRFDRPEETERLRQGDVISYMPEPNDTTVVTHRVVARGVTIEGDPSVITKGDANTDPDTYDHPITHTQIVGKVLYGVPGYGHVLHTISPEIKQSLRTPVLSTLGAWALVEWWLVLRRLREPREDRTPREPIANRIDVSTTRKLAHAEGRRPQLRHPTSLVPISSNRPHG